MVIMCQKNNFIFFLIILFLSPCACALSSDKLQSIFFNADSAELNRETGVNILRGHVSLTQGSSRLMSDTLILYLDKNNELVQVIAEGKPATYSTLTDKHQPRLFAKATIIKYFPLNSRVLLMGNASVIQGLNSYTAPTIDYKNEEQRIISAPSTKGKVKIVVQPQSLLKKDK